MTSSHSPFTFGVIFFLSDLKFFTKLGIPVGPEWGSCSYSVTEIGSEFPFIVLINESREIFTSKEKKRKKYLLMFLFVY